MKNLNDIKTPAEPPAAVQKLMDGAAKRFPLKDAHFKLQFLTAASAAIAAAQERNGQPVIDGGLAEV